MRVACSTVIILLLLHLITQTMLCAKYKLCCYIIFSRIPPPSDPLDRNGPLYMCQYPIVSLTQWIVYVHIFAYKCETVRQITLCPCNMSGVSSIMAPVYFNANPVSLYLFLAYIPHFKKMKFCLCDLHAPFMYDETWYIYRGS
jgi:hypothetical protein